MDGLKTQRQEFMVEYVECAFRECPARALVSVAKILPSLQTDDDELVTLELCGHHFNMKHAILLLHGFEVMDDDRLEGQVYDTAKFRECPVS